MEALAHVHLPVLKMYHHRGIVWISFLERRFRKIDVCITWFTLFIIIPSLVHQGKQLFVCRIHD